MNFLQDLQDLELNLTGLALKMNKSCTNLARKTVWNFLVKFDENLAKTYLALFLARPCKIFISCKKSRSLASGFGRFRRNNLTKKGPLTIFSVQKVPLLKNKLHILKQKVHCYNYSIQGHRNWPRRLSSCQAKVSSTIKNCCDHWIKQTIKQEI